MTISTDKAESTKPKSEQDGFSQADQHEESHASDSNTPKSKPIENEAPLESPVDPDDGADLEPEEEEELVSASATPQYVGILAGDGEHTDEEGADKFSDAERRLREELAAFKLK